MTLLNTANKVYLGTATVNRVYAGTTRVWPPTSRPWTPADLALQPQMMFKHYDVVWVNGTLPVGGSDTISTCVNGGTAGGQWRSLDSQVGEVLGTSAGNTKTIQISGTYTSSIYPSSSGFVPTSVNTVSVFAFYNGLSDTDTPIPLLVVKSRLVAPPLAEED